MAKPAGCILVGEILLDALDDLGRPCKWEKVARVSTSSPLEVLKLYFMVLLASMLWFQIVGKSKYPSKQSLCQL